MEKLKLGIFDLDGTVKTREGFPDSVIKGIENVWNQGITTTIMTGKGRAHLERAMGLHWKNVIHPSMPVGVENGGRITNHDGTLNLVYHPLPDYDIQHMIELISSDEIPFLLYVPEQLSEKARIWVQDDRIREELLPNHKDYDIFTASRLELYNKIIDDNPCMFVFQPRDENFRNEIDSSLNVVSNEGVLHINSSGIDKGSGVRDIADIMNTNPDQILIAGNDENDIPMLNYPHGKKIFVGNSFVSMITVPNVTMIESVDEFGNYLQSFS